AVVCLDPSSREAGGRAGRVRPAQYSKGDLARRPDLAPARLISSVRFGRRRSMTIPILLTAMWAMPLLARDPLAQRIGHHDPSKYRRSRSHGSVGDMACQTLLPGNALTTNFYFMHRCQITPGGGVGHHFHNTTEEMFIVFDGQAEFTVDGRTSVLKGTA